MRLKLDKQIVTPRELANILGFKTTAPVLRLHGPFRFNLPGTDGKPGKQKAGVRFILPEVIDYFREKGGVGGGRAQTGDDFEWPHQKRRHSYFKGGKRKAG